ncbi:hypothetical protein BKA67DRAFT_296824 [Truncatella angustata]|uniref:Uncharacterized protein n=1 Tax=Truncatella angustata TaxID=152316 RepID=A0A9P8UIJ0_9PEZI|nr:uncharacterized protein BKA67DRAFT_296824 [Truncatella angustata]KAH6652663.1 hypothetical protein BKA67DRAFT_296824 [Truncatella angustata]
MHSVFLVTSLFFMSFGPIYTSMLTRLTSRFDKTNGNVRFPHEKFRSSSVRRHLSGFLFGCPLNAKSCGPCSTQLCLRTSFLAQFHFVDIGT